MSQTEWDWVAKFVYFCTWNNFLFLKLLACYREESIRGILGSLFSGEEKTTEKVSRTSRPCIKECCSCQTRRSAITPATKLNAIKRNFRHWQESFKYLPILCSWKRKFERPDLEKIFRTLLDSNWLKPYRNKNQNKSMTKCAGNRFISFSFRPFFASFILCSVQSTTQRKQSSANSHLIIEGNVLIANLEGRDESGGRNERASSSLRDIKAILSHLPETFLISRSSASVKNNWK